MKQILTCHPDEELLSTLEVILKHWGYRVMASPSGEHLISFLSETPPDLLLISESHLAALDAGALELIRSHMESGPAPLFVLQEGELAPSLQLPVAHTLGLPIDIFDLFNAVQTHLESTPRKNLRMEVCLPGIVSPAGKSGYMGEVLSLSPGGMFIKVGGILEPDGDLQVVIPLLGISRELEIEGKVLYRVAPTPKNNYMQGAGIAFTGLSDEDRELLSGYLESCFLSELQERGEAATDLDSSCIRLHNREITIKLLRNRR